MELKIMKNIKWLWYAILVVAFLLITFFGIGPVVFADGNIGERMITLGVVIILYVILGVLFMRIKKQGK
jgi:protein-S-isoprenylcysteine O-methyltransferase Ste14